MKAINIRLDETLLNQVKEIAKTYKISYSEFIREAISKEIESKKSDFFYKLSHVKHCSKEENDEIVEELQNLSDEELQIKKSETIML